MAPFKRLEMIAAFVIATALAPTSLTAQGTADIPVGAMTVTEDRLPEPQSQLPGVVVKPDIAYATLPGFRPLRLDLYAPADGTAARPLIIFVHGGGWTIGTKRSTGNFEDWPGVLADFARLGYVVASVEYRLSGEAPYPSAVIDVKDAIRFLRSNAGQYGIDPDRVALWGGSAGAHLAAMAATTCNDPAFPASDPVLQDISDCVQAFVGWYGTYDISEMLRNVAAAAASEPSSPSTQEDVEVGGGMAFFQCTAQGCPPGLTDEASPIRHLDASDPPTLLLHGTTDTLVPLSQSEMMAKAMRDAGMQVDLQLIEGVGHGWVQPGDLAATQRGSRQAIAATISYISRVLPAKP